MTSVVETGTDRIAGVDEIRAQFPALERTHGGFPVAYFDIAAPSDPRLPNSGG